MISPFSLTFFYLNIAVYCIFRSITYTKVNVIRLLLTTSLVYLLLQKSSIWIVALLLSVVNYFVCHLFYYSLKKSNIFLQIWKWTLIGLFLFACWEYRGVVFSDVNGIYAYYPLLGVSMIFFHSYSYLIETCEKNTIRVLGIDEYLLFVLLYFKIIAGPIEKPNLFVKRLEMVEKKNGHTQWSALLPKAFYFFSLGLFKKFLLSNPLGFIAQGISAYQQITGLKIFTVCGSIVYTFQIIIEVLAYNDLMMGYSTLLGFPMQTNYNKPFLSKSLGEFFSRYQIGHQHWLIEYAYTPLNKLLSQHFSFASGISVIATLLITSFWHHPKFSYLFFGFLIGLCLINERILIQNFGRFKNLVLFFDLRLLWIVYLILPHFILSESLPYFSLVSSISSLDLHVRTWWLIWPVFSIGSLVILDLMERTGIHNPSKGIYQPVITIGIQTLALIAVFFLGWETNSNFIYAVF